jgi:hypothetical protein
MDSFAIFLSFIRHLVVLQYRNMTTRQDKTNVCRIRVLKRREKRHFQDLERGGSNA